MLYLQWVDKYLEKFIPNCWLWWVANQIRKHLVDKKHNYGNDAMWMANKLPKIIWYLKNFEVKEF